MKTVRWGIIGPGAIAHNFADGLKGASAGELVSIASHDTRRRTKFGDRYSVSPKKRRADYDSLITDPEVDAVYVSTPHPFHAELAIRAMRAGKHVLCEKPAGMTASQVIAMIEVAAQSQVFFMEAFMYRCHPQIDRVLNIIDSGEIGDVDHIRASFGYSAAFNAESKIFNYALGGGGILDVGCYPVSFARLIAGTRIGQRFDNPREISATGILSTTGVDEVAFAVLRFDSGVTAECAAAVTRQFDNSATITGPLGSIHLPDPWTPGRDAGPSDATITIHAGGNTRKELIQQPEQLFVFEAEFASQSIMRGDAEPSSPSLSHQDSVGNATVLDQWRHAVGYLVSEETPAGNRVVPGVLPAELIQIPKQQLPGIDKPMSSLILGCDNQPTLSSAAIVWDAWMESGGNAFDTAFVYGSGSHEQMLGQWIQNRGVTDDVIVTVKGAHTPYCTPGAIDTQLDMSLERLNLSKAPIYIMHRDNPDVPVSEFVDVLNKKVSAGRIGIFGGSNWSIERFREANEYARANDQQGFSILNNNLSLAVMEKPVWAGCVTSHTSETLAYLEQANIIHFAWSSQARGYFLPADLRNRLPKSTSPETCFGSPDNEERRRRAATLAKHYGVSTHNIATAWVLAQNFPSFALTGPRSVAEILTTLPALKLTLTKNDLAWLDLSQSQTPEF